MNQIDVLYVEDNNDDIDYIKDVLGRASRKKYDITVVQNLADAKDTLEHYHFEIILLDINLPDSRGIDTIASMLHHAPETPILLMTDMGDDDLGRKAIQSGVQDFLSKDRINKELLTRSIDYAIERKKNELRLLQSQERYFSLFQDSKDGILIHTTEGVILEANQQAIERLSVDGKTLVGKNLFDLCLFESKKTLEEALKTLHRKSYHRTEINFKDNEESFYTGDVQFSVFQTGEDRPEVQSIIRDITTQRKIETNLKQAKSAADKANQAKTEFLCSMSHEIRTPLNSIMGTAEILKEGKLDSTQNLLVDRMLRAGEGLLELINDILDLGRIEARKVNKEKDIFNLKELCLRSLDIVSSKGEQKGLKLEFVPDGELPTHVNGDSRHIRQVLFNFISNAIKFTDHGSVKLKVKKTSSLRDKTFIRFSVVDTGKGISLEDQQRVFTQFTQLDPMLPGTGLGLTICKKIASLLNGKVWLESTEGMGSSFHFELPLEEVIVDEQVIAERKRIAICLNNNREYSSIEHFLYRHGSFTIINVPGEKLSEYLSSHEKFDLLITDYTYYKDRNIYDATKVYKDHNRIFEKTIVLLPLLCSKVIVEQIKKVEHLTVVERPFNESVVQENILKRLDEEIIEESKKAEEQVKQEKRSKVLIVEDSNENVFILKMFLKNHPLDLEVAENGAVAVEKFNNTDYDLILMDISMPIMDGYEATSQIRKIEAEKNKSKTPIIALTAYAFEDEKEKCFSAGCDDYLSKPIKKQILVDKIQEIFAVEDIDEKKVA